MLTIQRFSLIKLTFIVFLFSRTENIFVISFYHVAKPMSRAENMIKHKIKREASSQRLPVS